MKEPIMCVYKEASATAYDKCYICDGFDNKCENYKLQLLLKRGAEF